MGSGTLTEQKLNIAPETYMCTCLEVGNRSVSSFSSHAFKDQFRKRP